MYHQLVYIGRKQVTCRYIKSKFEWLKVASRDVCSAFTEDS